MIIDHQVEELLPFAIQHGFLIATAFAVVLLWPWCNLFFHLLAGTHCLPFRCVLTLIAWLHFGLLNGLAWWFHLRIAFVFVPDFIKIEMWQFPLMLVLLYRFIIDDVDGTGIDVESVQDVFRNTRWISRFKVLEEVIFIGCLHVLERTLTLQQSKCLFYLVLLCDDDPGLSATRVRQAGLTAVNQEGAAVLRVELQSFSRLLMQLHGSHGV